MSRLIFSWLVALAGVLAPRARGADPAPEKPAEVRKAALEKAGYTRVPLALENTLLYVDGAVGGEKVKFLLDTGNQGTALDLKVADKLKMELGKEVTAVGVGGLTAKREAHVAGLKIGSFDFGKDAAALTLYAADHSVWPKVPGILAAELLDATGAVIDYPARALYLRPPLKRDPAAKAPPADPLRERLVKDGYAAVPMEREPAGQWMVTAGTGKHDFRLMVDTGANVTALDATGLEKWGVKSLGVSEAWGFGGRAKTEKVSLRGLTLGKYDTRRSWQEVYGGSIDLTLQNEALAQQKRKPMSGLLGGLDLLNGSAVIDLATSTLYLRPIRETVSPRLDGRWVAGKYEVDGEKGEFAPGSLEVEFKGNLFRSTQNKKTVEWAFHLEDLGDHFRVGQFKPDVDELAAGFRYYGGGLLKLEGDTLLIANAQGKNRPLPTELAAPKGSKVLLVEFRRG